MMSGIPSGLLFLTILLIMVSRGYSAEDIEELEEESCACDLILQSEELAHISMERILP